MFGFVGYVLDKKRFLGPNVLKTVLCITPLLLLLLYMLNTAKDGSKYKEVVSKLCFYVTVDLFDSVEMLDIVLDQKEHNYGIPKEFGEGMIALACLSLLLSPWQMAENNLKEEKPKKRTALLRNIFEIVIDLVVLIVRLVIVSEYKKDESIFIAKNGIHEEEHRGFFSLPQGASVAVDALQKEIITPFPTVQSNYFSRLRHPIRNTKKYDKGHFLQRST